MTSARKGAIPARGLIELIAEKQRSCVDRDQLHVDALRSMSYPLFGVKSIFGELNARALAVADHRAQPSPGSWRIT
jgi:hypothetical protein